MFKISIDNEEVITDSNIEIKEEFMNPSSIILDKVYPKSWKGTNKLLTDYYFPKDYSKCKIYDETYYPSSDGTTVEYTSINADVNTEYNWDYQLKGDTEQTTYTGKNLFNPTDFINKNNVSCSNIGVLSSTGISSTNWNYSNRNIGLILKKGTYTFSLNFNTVGSTNNLLCMRIYDSSDYQLGEIRRNNTPGVYSTTITLEEDTTIGIMFKMENNDTTIFQLEQGSTVTSYEPYVGGTPSPNPDYPQEVKTVTGYNEVNITGKNLFNKNNVPNSNLNRRLDANGNNYAETGYFSSNFIKVIPKTIYTINYTPTAMTRICYYDNSKTFISKNDTASTFTTSTNCKYIRFCNLQTMISEIQVEKGTEATEYEPYKEQTYEIDLGKNLFDYNLMKSWSSTIRYIPVSVEKNTNYTLSTSNVGQGTNSANIFFTTTNSGASSSSNGVWKDRPKTINSGDSNVLYVAYRGSETDKTDYWYQLERGSTATSYAPFMKNENLFDKDNMNTVDNAYISQDNVTSTISSSGAGLKILYIPIIGGKTYTIAKHKGVVFRVATTIDTPAIGVATYQGYWADTALIEKDVTYTITTNNDAKYLLLNYYRTSDTYTEEEIVNSITIWDTGQAQYPIELPNGNYIYKNNDKWYVHKVWDKIVLDGSYEENWAYSSSNVVFFSDVIRNIAEHNNEMYCSHFTIVPTSTSYANMASGTIKQDNNNSSRLIVKYTDYTTLADFKSWLSIHNVTVWYKLATEVDVEITNDDLISQLEAVNLLNGINNISTYGVTLDPIMKLHYNYYDEYTTEDLYFCGIVKNSANMVLNPFKPHYCSLQILDPSTLLSEGKTLDFVIVNKTIKEAITQVINSVADYGFVVGNILINDDSIIGAYSTQDKTAFDVLDYLAQISRARWGTRMIDENTTAIDVYDPALLENEDTIECIKEYFEKNDITDLDYSFSTTNYRNKQVIISDAVYASISSTETIIANGYQTQYNTEKKIGNIKSVTIDGEEVSFTTNARKDVGISADIYYTPGNQYIESDIALNINSIIVVEYIALVEGRQVFNNYDEINRINENLDRNGTIARYEKRNDVISSNELSSIAQSYIKYKGLAEIVLNISSRKDFLKLGNKYELDSPVEDLNNEYLVKSKTTKIVRTPDLLSIKYEYELTNSFDTENEINYFNNQRAKANGNIAEGEFISTNVDIENTANIIFYGTTIEEATVIGDNVLDSVLDSPLNN